MFSVVYARDIKNLDTSLKLSPDELDCGALTKTAKKKKSTSIAIQSHRAIMEQENKKNAMVWQKTQKPNSFGGSCDHLEDEF